MRRADFYSALRIALAPLFFIVYFIPVWTGSWAPLTVYVLLPLFAFMEFTDYLDGYYARKLNQVSDFGKLFDPFADVLANMTVMLVFVVSGYMPAILFIIVIYREMGITFIRMMASRKGVAIGARKGGKLKTVLYIIAAGFSLVIESALRLSFDIGQTLSSLLLANRILYGLAVLVAVLSFIDYLHAFASVLKSPSTT